MPEPIQDSARYYNFSPLTILLNHKTPDMDGVICPSDSRFRGDQRLFEEGKTVEADAEKVVLE